MSRFDVTTAFENKTGISVWRTNLVSRGAGFASERLVKDECWTAYPELYHAEDESVRIIPPSLYLGLLRVDVHSEQSILDFCSTYGPMAGSFWNECIPVEWVDQRLAGGRYSSRLRERLIREAFAELAGLSERVDERSEGEDEPFFHVDEFRVRAKMLRDATRTWLSVSGARTWAWAVENWESGNLFIAPDEPGAAMTDFVLPLLNLGLSALHPRIRFANDVQPYDSTLYSALCLQLAVAIRDQQDYVDCPICGVAFSKDHRAYESQMQRLDNTDLFETTDVRKRAKDIKYCSVRCANVSSSRKYRERQWAERVTGFALPSEAASRSSHKAESPPAER